MEVFEYMHFFFSSRRRHTRSDRDWSSDVCSSDLMDSERRHAPRYPFIAEAVVTEISSDTKLIAKTGDLSIGGCFLDMLNPTPQGTQVRLRISHQGATFTA